MATGPERTEQQSSAAAASCDWPAWRVPVRVSLTVSQPHDCAYLPGRVATTRAFGASRIDPDVYHDLMDAGFRRSGRIVYQPVCSGCRACQPIRVPVATFAASKSQRRVWRRNQDLTVSVISPTPSDEKFALYQRYQTEWHDGAMAGGWADFTAFLYDSPVDTLEVEYRLPDDGRLVAVGICDVSARSLSSVYFYFDPAEASRGLGTFGALYEIDLARRLSVPYYYLGFWVVGSARMEYKAAFRPCEVLRPEGDWHVVASL